jgi:hypothetical protein
LRIRRIGKKKKGRFEVTTQGGFVHLWKVRQDKKTSELSAERVVSVGPKGERARKAEEFGEHSGPTQTASSATNMKENR